MTRPLMTLDTGLEVDELDVTLPDGRTLTVTPAGEVTVAAPGKAGYRLTLPTVEQLANQWRLADYPRDGAVRVAAHYLRCVHS